MNAKELVVALIMGLGLISLTLGLLSPASGSSATLQKPTLPKLETFAINIESVGLNKGTQGYATPPRAMVTVRVQVTNLGMEDKRDVLLRLTLENNRDEIVIETSLLVYVPYQKTNAYTVDIATRDGGNLNVIAEVVSQGRAVMAKPIGVVITPIDLLV